MAFILFGLLLFLLVFTVPVGVSMLVSVFACIGISDKAAFLQMVVQRMFVAMDSFSNAAVPCFILAGTLMEYGGISKRLISFVGSLLGWLPGRLSCITVGGAAFFGAISGSNAATVSAIGGIMIPQMKKAGYSADECAAVAASAGTLGVIVPPSVPMIIYAITASVSTSAMFIGGIMPGVILATVLICLNVYRHRHIEPSQKTGLTLRQFLLSFKEAFLALMMPVIIMGGIYGGICTPTEAAAISCFYAFVVSVFIYQELRLKDLPRILVRSAQVTAMIMFVVAACSPFQWYMTTTGITKLLSAAIIETFHNPYVILFIVNIVMLVMGCFLETSAIILLITPVFLPVIIALGMDPVWFGVIMIINTSIGMITPPMALNCFVASGISGVSLEEVSKKIIVFLLFEIAVLLVLTYMPDLVLWIPRMTGYNG
jgi:C4-dicarboxylate transporter DctM subunit